MLSFTYSGRYALHRVVVGDTASEVGQTGPMEVVPSVRMGVSIGAGVLLRRPRMKALLTDVTFGTGRAAVTDGTAFEFIQTLR